MTMRPIMALVLASALLGGSAAPLRAAICVSTNTAVVAASVGAIAGAVGAIPSSLTGDYCMVLNSNGPYTENAVIQNINTNNYQIVITTAAGLAPTVLPSVASPIFTIRNASVTLQGFTVDTNPGGSFGFGVIISSPNVVLSSMTVKDTNGRYSVGGVQISSFDSVQNSAITVGLSRSLDINGSRNYVADSTMANNAATTAVIIHVGNSSNTITRSFLTNPGGRALTLDGSNNTVSVSTINGGSPVPAADLIGTSNSISNSFVSNTIGAAVLFNFSAGSSTVSQSWLFSSASTAAAMVGGAAYNSIRFSTIQSQSSQFAALWLNNASSNVFVQDMFLNSISSGVFIEGGSFGNWFGSGVIVNNGLAAPALLIVGSSSNTFTQGWIGPMGSTAVVLGLAASLNTISQTTITAAGLTASALVLNGASSNTVAGSYLQSNNGAAAILSGNATSNTISRSTLTTSGAAFVGLYLNGVSNNTIAQSNITNPNGHALYLNNSSSNTIMQSAITTNSSSFYALLLNGTSTTTITQSVVLNTNGAAAFLNTNSNFNFLSQSAFSGTWNGVPGNNTPALWLAASSSNTISQCAITSPNAVGVTLDANANFNTIVMSTVNGGVPPGAGVYLNSNSSNTISASFISAAGPILINGSTGTVVSSNVIVSLYGNGGAGIKLTGGSVNLTASSNTINGTAGVGNYPIWIDPSNSGQILITSNTLSVRPYAGISVNGAQNPGTNILISSNTIVPFSFALGDTDSDTYGIYLYQLTSGATIQYNSIYWRAPSSYNDPSKTAFGIFAFQSNGLNIHHNRISNPAMINSGNFIGIFLRDTPNSIVKFNDVYSAGTGLASSCLLEATGNSSGAQVKDNVFFSNIAAPGNTSFSALNINLLSQAGFVSNYNDFFAPPGSNAGVWGASAYSLVGLPGNVVGGSSWQSNTGQDANSITVDPLWAGAAPGAEDFHPRSRGGRWVPALQTFVTTDLNTSQTIDSADFAEPFSNELPPNWSRANQGSYGNTAEASLSYPHLQILLPGESGAPYTPSGKSGTPQIAMSIPFTVKAFAANQNGVQATWPQTEYVSLSTTSAIASNFNPANLPFAPPDGPQPVFFNGMRFNATTASPIMSLVANDVGPAYGLYSDTSTVFQVYGVTTASPTASPGIPPNSLVGSLGGKISGTAADSIAVFQVTVGLQQLFGAGNWLNFNSGLWNLGPPAQFTAALSVPNGASTNWSINIPDSYLQNGASYFVLVQAYNSSNNMTTVSSTFTFNPQALTGGAPGDGQGAASVSALKDAPGWPLSLSGCQVNIASIAFTAGGVGISTGGMIALRIPDGWTKPVSTTSLPSGSPYPAGYVSVISTTGFVIDLNPPNEGPAILGDNWIVYRATTSVSPGQPILFSYAGFPAGVPQPVGASPSGARSMGNQVFALMTQGGPGGNLKPIAAAPSVALAPGTPDIISFWPQDPLSLSPLQVSSTMYLVLTDDCGVATTNGGPIAVSLYAGNVGVIDSSAAFTSNGAPLPQQQATIAGGSAVSSPFNVMTTTSGINFEFLIGTTSALGQPTALRFVNILSSVSLTGVSVDNGNPAAGGLTAALPANAFNNPVFINFTMSNPNAHWEVIISSTLFYYPEVVHRLGLGNPGRSLTWNGINERATPNQFLSTGTYFVKIVVEGGVAVSQALSVTIPQSASIYGMLNSPGALVQAVGPGTNYGNFSVADASGRFQVYGLTDGAVYNVIATTTVFFSGQLIRQSQSLNNITALNAGANAGTSPFPTPALLRVSATLPFAAPKELFGSVSVHNADFSRTYSHTVHFSSGSGSSDSGAQSFGGTASTFSIIGVSPDTYTVAINVYQLGLSTSIYGVAALAGTNADVVVALPKKANVYGYAVLPSTTTNGAFVSVQATQAGSKNPIFGGAFIPPPSAVAGVLPTSSTWGLFGLDPGVWTITARSQGLAPSSNTLTILGSADVGNPLTGGFDLFLKTGGVIVGTVAVPGNSMGLADGQPGTPGFNLFVNAYNPVTFTHAAALVRMTANSSYTSSSFTLSGLDDGLYFVNVHQNGFADAQQTIPVVSGFGSANLSLAPNSAQVLLSVRLPGPPRPSDFQNVALLVAGSGVLPMVKQDMTNGSAMDFFTTSATWHSPPLGPGFYRFDALYGPTGQFRSVTIPLTNGATAAMTMDLSGPTYAVSGSAVLAGNVSLASATFSVTVSSVAGLLLATPTTSYCLMGQALPITTSTFHMELIPINPRSAGFLTGSLYPAPSPAAGCGQVVMPTLGPDDPNPMMGYLAPVSPADGGFLFPAVAPGTYILRNSSELDNNPGDGPELPQIRQTISVGTAAVSVGTFRIDAGHAISGNLLGPAQTNLTGSFAVSLMDGLGTILRTIVVGFNSANAGPYVFDKLADGTYAIRVQDQSFPPAYAARPLVVKIAGANQTGKDINLVQGGVIKGKISVQQILPNGTTGPFLLVSQSNAAILPQGFQILARADPWFQGGLKFARGQFCGPGGCQAVSLDGNDQFVIDSLLPGVYDVNFLSRNNSADTSAGGINLVSTVLPGVSVAEGRTTDLGVVNLVSALDLRGRVYEAATSSAAANVKMEARPSNRQQATQDVIIGQTDVNGNFVLSGLNPKIRYYDIFAASRGDAEAVGAVLPPYEQKIIASVDLSSVSALNIPLDWARRSLVGQVTFPPGGPPMLLPFGQGSIRQPGALIFIQKANVIPTRNPLGDIQAVTDPNGNFNITSLSTGTYRLTFTALNYGSLTLGVTIMSTGATGVGVLTLPLGATLSGAIRKADGSNPSQTDIKSIVAVTPDLQNVLFAALDKDANTRTFTGYTVSGFKTGLSYKLLILGPRDILSPAEAQNIVFTSTGAMTLDVLYRQPRPSVLAKARRSGSNFTVQFETSQALRNKTDNDNTLALILTTVSASGVLGQFDLSSDRTKLSAVYTPGVGESSFTLALSGRSVIADPDSIDPVNPEFSLSAQATFYIGIDGLANNNISNFQGGNALIEGDAGRVTIPNGAFAVDASSSPQLTLQISSDTLAKVRTSGFRTAEEANIAALRYAPAAYPEHLLRAMAATPPQINPFSAFYDILLPLGVRTALSRPVALTVSYSSSTDPGTLNLYWFNAAANAYILQQDVTGAAPVIDTVNHTITINVNHFSTFVLFQTGVNVITGAAFAGTDITVYNFPNPFDLSVKTINTIHPVTAQTVRGTLINISLPPNAASGNATLRIFNTIGERIRTIDLGFLNAGTVFYQPWDGRNDSGHDVANGVYIGQVKFGNTSKFFKMAVIK